MKKIYNILVYLLLFDRIKLYLLFADAVDFLVIKCQKLQKEVQQVCCKSRDLLHYSIGLINNISMHEENILKQTELYNNDSINKTTNQLLMYNAS